MKIKIDTPKYIYEVGKRENQEDYIWPQAGMATSDDRLFVVCDGMGGHENGEVASEAVGTAIGEWFEQNIKNGAILTDDDVEKAIAHAYQALDKKDPQGASRMGTTLTAIALHRGGCIAAHMGDSRIYHINKRERRIRYKSRDHSLVHDLWMLGEITREEMATHPRRNLITKAMQSGEERRQRATIVHIGHLEKDDYLYLCSDGMLEQMDDQEIVDILCGSGSDDEKIELLTQATVDNSDNHSAYLIHIADLEHEEGDDNLKDDAPLLTDPEEPIKVERGEMIDIDEDDEIEGIEGIEEDSSQSTKNASHSTWKWLLVLLALVVIATIGAIIKTSYFNNP